MPTYTSAAQWKPVVFNTTYSKGQSIPSTLNNYALSKACIRAPGWACLINSQRDVLDTLSLTECLLLGEPDLPDQELAGKDMNWGIRSYGVKQHTLRRVEIRNIFSEHAFYATDMGGTLIADCFFHHCGAQGLQFRPETQTLPPVSETNPVAVTRVEKSLFLNNGRKGGIGRAGYMLTFFHYEDANGAAVVCNRSVEIVDTSVIHEGGAVLDNQGHQSLGGIKILKRPTVLLSDVLIRLTQPAYDAVFVRDAQKVEIDRLESSHNVCLADCRKVSITNSSGAGLIQLGTMEKTPGGDRWKLVRTVGPLSSGYVGSGV